MSRTDPLSCAYARQCFRYVRGQLYWRKRPLCHFVDERSWRSWNSSFAGKEAGCPDNKEKPRWIVRVNNRRMTRYQIVWVMFKGTWAPLIDHKNRNQLDDRVGNLRSATQSQNLANSKLACDNKSGYKGVSWKADKAKWLAVITVRGRQIHLGYFGDPAAAGAAYVRAAKEHFGAFYSSG